MYKAINLIKALFLSLVMISVAPLVFSEPVTVKQWNNETPILVSVTPGDHDSGWKYTIRSKRKLGKAKFDSFSVVFNSAIVVELAHRLKSGYAEAHFFSCGDSVKTFSVTAFYEEDGMSFNESEVVVNVVDFNSCK
ncbi:hypothetical protein [Teredinibacter sp. KSP-S5-2]|uniref:hypothetical protein n=1 Tax=Teredinibacter sp. KSP-S5-2 TaxID=3034506 RepID=UPI002934570D|nr:hypothetical protein [Teredinibacter sp. KSP-S5-2]WNO09961.1 hypothetical protein P5V12_02130 [Teredinibacter sp. KSP-S5-2]